jgi:C-terminal processing protease CtpA/Prc
MKRTRALLILLAVWLLSTAALAAEKGWFGFAIAVDAEGLSLNPTLRSITVQKIFASSPAALAGLASGDSVVEVEGIVVAGTKADVLKAALQKSVGETLHLKIRRGAAAVREVSMVAEHEPRGQ